jgi:hypothetical protein
MSAAVASLCAPVAFAEEDVPAAMSDAAQDAMPPEPASPRVEAEPDEAAAGSVTRAVFALAMEGREPGDAVTSVPASAEKVYFFTELRDLAGQTVTHRWEHAGAVMAAVDFEVRGPRWRVHSSKKLMPGWGGAWKVSVVDATGRVLHEASFEYEEPDEPDSE